MLDLKAQTVACRDFIMGLDFKPIIDDANGPGFEFTLEPPSTYRLLTRLSEAGFVGLVEPEESHPWFEESAQ